MESNSIDMEKLMEEIKETINSRNYVEPNIKFKDIEMEGMGSVISTVFEFDLKELEQNVIYANERCNIEAYRYLSSYRPVLGKFVTFLKKIVRKICKFYVEPIVEDQNGFNISITRTCNQLLAYVKEMQKENDELKARINELEKKCNK
jgi:hypothetical protein